MKFLEYDPDEFFSAERYPLPITCGECGHTMRPVHKHYTPDMPRTYFCTFCGAGFYEDNPGIRFREKQTNADRIRQMSDEELAAYLSKVQGDIFRGEMRLTAQWRDWLKEVDNGGSDS